MGFERIPILDILGSVWCLRHQLRSVQHHHTRHLILSDSMSGVLARNKGRASALGMLCLAHVAAAHLLGSGSAIALRWLPGELNLANASSRR